ncbi:hypothetical protein [Streptomyces lasiicapitis]|nr:hypothetical protein [Streptomyces lasiicapitis]
MSATYDRPVEPLLVIQVIRREVTQDIQCEVVQVVRREPVAS